METQKESLVQTREPFIYLKWTPSKMDWQAQQVLKLWCELASKQMTGPKSLHEGQFNIMYLDNTKNTREVLLCAKGYIQ